MKSSNKEKLDEVIKATEPFLLRSGFSRQKSTFNRTAEPGLVHVIQFGMGQSWSAYQDKFTVDVGVFISEAFTIFYPYIKKVPKVASIANCEITRRLPAFQEGIEDHWWDLDGYLGEASIEVNDLLLRYGIPFLDSLGSRQAIIKEWEEKGNSIGFYPRGRLVIAVLHKILGNDAAAQRLVQTELEEEMGLPPENFVREVADKLALCIEK